MIDGNEVKALAEKEFQEEEFRRKVELEKQRLRVRKQFLNKLWPWTLVRKDDPDWWWTTRVSHIIEGHGLELQHDYGDRYIIRRKK